LPWWGQAPGQGLSVEFKVMKAEIWSNLGCLKFSTWDFGTPLSLSLAFAFKGLALGFGVCIWRFKVQGQGLGRPI
jgi:hypothetical protein